MRASTEVALLLTASDRASAVVNALTANANKKMSAIASAGKKLSDMGPKMMVVGDALTGFFSNTAKEAQYANAQYKVLEQSLANLGDKADASGKGIVAQQLAAAADAFEKKTGIEAEAVMQVQQNLALYKSVISKQSRDNGLFNKAVETAFDMQAKGMGDAASSAKAMGMALENPVKNLAKLEKASKIFFTEDEKRKVAALVSTGHKAAAQQLIMDKVNNKVKGAAQAAADPLKVIDAQIGDIREEIGNALLPVIGDFAKSFGAFVTPITGFIKENPALIKSIAGIGVALLVVGKTVTFVSSIVAAGPWGIAFTVIAMAAAAIIANWDKIGPFFSKMWAKITGFFSSAWKFIKNLFLNYTPQGLIIKHWDKITKFFSALWAGIKTGVKVGWEFIKNLFLNYTPHGLIIKHWDKISSFFVGVWDNVKGVFSGWIDWVFGLGSRMVDAGGNIVTSIWKGIQNKAQVLIDGVKGIAQKIRDFFPFSPAKAGPLRDIHKIKLVETIAQSVNASPLINSLTGVAGKVLAFQPKMQAFTTPALAMRPAPSIPNSRGGGMSSISFSPVYNLSGSATHDDAKRISSMTMREFETFMKKYEAQNRRLSIGG